MSRSFWSEYFAMLADPVPTRPSRCQFYITILAECNRRWNPNYEKQLRSMIPPKDSKRKARLVRMYWAMKCGKVVANHGRTEICL